MVVRCVPTSVAGEGRDEGDEADHHGGKDEGDGADRHGGKDEGDEVDCHGG